MQDDGNLVNYRYIGSFTSAYVYWASDIGGGTISCHH